MQLIFSRRCASAATSIDFAGFNHSAVSQESVSDRQGDVYLMQECGQETG